MVSFGVYSAVLFGPIAVIVISGLIILTKLPLKRFVSLLESVFHFRRVRNVGENYIVIEVCDDKFELVDTFMSRLPFVFAVGMCLLVAILVFIEGCIFSTRHVYSTRVCSTRTPNCFLFRSDLSAFKPLYQFVCEADKPVIPSNMSASYAVCYGFVLPDQSSIDILNQLGVCTGILSLVDSLYPHAYKFARKKVGRICLIILLCSLVVLEAIVLSIQVNITFMTIILITLTEVLLLNIFFLHHRRVKSPPYLDKVGSYVELNEVN